MEIINEVYTKFSLVYELSQGKDLEHAKHLAYVAIRNSLGVLIFFSILFIHCSIDLFLFDISVDRSDTPIFLIYLGFAIFIIGYLYLAKKYLKPRLKLIPQLYFKENLKASMSSSSSCFLFSVAFHLLECDYYIFILLKK